jgi:hypothetical protein
VTALTAAVAYLEANAVGVRREHNGTDRYQADGGLLAVGVRARMSPSATPSPMCRVEPCQTRARRPVRPKNDDKLERQNRW